MKPPPLPPPGINYNIAALLSKYKTNIRMQFPHRYKQSSLCPIIPVDHDGGEISRKIYQTHQTKDKALSKGRFLIIIQNVEWAV